MGILNWLILVVCFIGCQESAKIEEGKYYAISLSDEENPFVQFQVDTVKVEAIKDRYIQWVYKTGFTQSSTVGVFRHIVKYELSNYNP